MHGQYAMIDYATSKTPYVYIECYIKAIFKDVARGSGWGGRAVPLGLSPPIGGGGSRKPKLTKERNDEK